MTLVVCITAACGGGGGGDDSSDAHVEHDADSPIDGEPSPDGPTTSCGSGVAPAGEITGTEGAAIAADGTVYYSQTGGVGRWVPDEAAPSDDWVSLAGTSTVWGMAIAEEGHLYVATPPSGATAGIIWEIDTTAASPNGTILFPSAGSPNGLTLGPDDAVYYGDFAGGDVYRVDGDGNRTAVSDPNTPFDAPNGVLFDADGTLLVAEYFAGEIWRVTLDANHAETARELLTDDAGRPDGIARDDEGRYYVTDNGGGRVLRYDASFGNQEILEQNVSAAANMAFGRGALRCTDLYVTSSGAMRVLDVGAAGVP